MLFNNFEPFQIPETGPISRAALKEAFPEFPEETVKLVVVPSRMKTQKRVYEKDKRNAGTRPIPPEPTGHKAVANIVIDGKNVNLQYSEVMPTIGAFSKSFPLGANRLQLYDNFYIQSHQEDLLFFLYFGFPSIANNGVKHRSGDPIYEFYRPGASAMKKIEEWRQKNEPEALVYKQMSYTDVQRVMAGLNITPKTHKNKVEEEAANRTLLLAKFKSGGELFKKTFHELVASSAPVVENDAPRETESELIDRLVNDDQLKEEDGAWLTRSKVNPDEWNKTAVWKSTKKGDEARFAFIEHLKSNTTLYDKLSK